MGSKGFIKRMLPFFATFAVGIFIASFFVNVGFSRFNFRARGWERHQRCERMRMENDQLRTENEQLRDQLESFDQVPHRVDHVKMIDLHTGEEKEVAVPFDAPMPPPPVAPHAPRHDR